MIINHLGVRNVQAHSLPESYANGVVAAFTPEEWKALAPAIKDLRGTRSATK